jgi:glucose-6-phosphate isomerase
MLKISGNSVAKIDRASDLYKKIAAVNPRLAAKDSTIWGPAAQAEASIRLNWIDAPESSRDLLPQLDALGAKFRNHTRVVLCGMGGSSLAPEVIAATYRKELFVLDSTDPVYIHHALAGDLRQTVVVVGSKSGSTIETASQRALFAEAFRTLDLNPVDHMVIVTDPGSPLDKSARADGYNVINADPNVGGRFSALTAFGLVPAALIGVDPSVLLDAASDAKRQILESEVAIDIAYLISKAGQYLTYCDSDAAPGLSDWIEQLVAESTGKNEVGRLPIVIENSAAAAAGDAFSIAFSGAADLVISGDLGEQFFLWEWVTALVGAALEIDPFNQPNVTEAKEATSALLSEWNGVMPEFTADAVDGAVEIFGAGTNLTEALRTFIESIPADGYVAVMAYLDRSGDRDLAKLREIIALKSNRPVTFGWGPRFLHSTGQFHKGGQQNGAFLQITGVTNGDVLIPGQSYGFKTLIMAQALGDLRALAKRKYPLLRLHLSDRSAGIAQLLKAAEAL